MFLPAATGLLAEAAPKFSWHFLRLTPFQDCYPRGRISPVVRGRFRHAHVARVRRDAGRQPIKWRYLSWGELFYAHPPRTRRQRYRCSLPDGTDTIRTRSMKATFTSSS
ncbi:MAG: hypothetical protein FE78DRAFT_363694, partial [Acidomyces sp. 'richmondensis']